MSKRIFGRSALAVSVLAALAAATPALAQTTITMESWRSEDSEIWNNVLIPAFEQAYPDINVEYTPTEPTQYDAQLKVKLEGGTAGDIITCRSFDNAQNLYDAGHMTSVKDLPELANFPDATRVAWQTDDGSDTFCLPMTSVLHGFIYNKEIFEELGLTPPTTEDEFFAVLDAIKADGSYVPLAMGTKDPWTVSTMGYYNIGVQYWKGEEGRKALIAGTKKLTDPEFLDPLRTLARWKDYLPPGYEAVGYSDSQSLFTLGRAAIFPAGSWEIPGFRAQADFEMGAFPPPKKSADDACYINDHPGEAKTINAASQNKEAATTFLRWLGSDAATGLIANAMPGMFPMSRTPAAIEDPVAQEFASWRAECQGSIRLSYQIISRGTPDLDTVISQATANILNGIQTPEDAAAEMQANIDAWYKPPGA